MAPAVMANQLPVVGSPLLEHSAAKVFSARSPKTAATNSALLISNVCLTARPAGVPGVSGACSILLGAATGDGDELVFDPSNDFSGKEEFCSTEMEGTGDCPELGASDIQLSLGKINVQRMLIC